MFPHGNHWHRCRTSILSYPIVVRDDGRRQAKPDRSAPIRLRGASPSDRTERPAPPVRLPRFFVFEVLALEVALRIDRFHFSSLPIFRAPTFRRPFRIGVGRCCARIQSTPLSLPRRNRRRSSTCKGEGCTPPGQIRHQTASRRR